MPIRSRRDRQLSQALERYLDDTLAAMPSEAELSSRYAFSPEFEARMSRLLQRARQEAGLPPIQPASQANGQADQRKQSSEPGHQADQLTYSFPNIPVGSDVRSPTRPGFRGMSGLPRRGKRLLLIAIILTILLSTFGLVAAREPIARFFVKVYERFTHIVFNIPDETVSPDATKGPGTANGAEVPRVGGPAVPNPGMNANQTNDLKVPSWLPDGYVQTSVLEQPDFLLITYANSIHEEILFERRPVNVAGIAVDTENAKTETVVVGKSEGIYYANKDVNNLVWQDGSYVYIISGNLTKSVAVHIGNSTK